MRRDERNIGVAVRSMLFGEVEEVGEGEGLTQLGAQLVLSIDLCPGSGSLSGGLTEDGRGSAGAAADCSEGGRHCPRAGGPRVRPVPSIHPTPRRHTTPYRSCTRKP